MNEKYPHGIGPAGRWLIFAGIPMAAWAIFFALTEPHHALEHAVGEKLFPYILAGVPASLMVLGMVVYGSFPKRLVVPLGIIGWAVSVAVLCWFFWFGPGSFGYHG
ncbi:MAG TPA: hypothetical protein VNZ25_08875 [Candidatus Angelobacter sp.]|jgi:hypothetical protein|nr:hypothetical protein [Candidatus Angelobacter sp.]